MNSAGASGFYHSSFWLEIRNFRHYRLRQNHLLQPSFADKLEQ